MSRQPDHAVSTLVGDVVPGPISRKGVHYRSAVRIEITNNIRKAVFWRNALGMCVTEPPGTPNISDERLYISIEYGFGDGVVIDYRDMLDEIDLPENHAERKEIVKALNMLDNGHEWYNQRVFSYTVSVSRHQIEKAGGVVYISDLDLVVGFGENASAAIHPFTPPGAKRYLNEQLRHCRGFAQEYLLVDNSGYYGNRWINTGFDVFELRAVSDPALRDGVYITTRVSTEKEPATIYYVLDDADKTLGLYPTRIQALEFGSPETRFQKELKEMEQQLARDKALLAQQRQEAEQEKHEAEMIRRKHTEELERSKEKLEWERSRLEYDRNMYAERQKFEYDMASRDRKDRSDVLKATMDIGKTILGLMSIGLSIYALVKKSQK